MTILLSLRGRMVWMRFGTKVHIDGYRINEAIKIIIMILMEKI